MHVLQKVRNGHPVLWETIIVLNGVSDTVKVVLPPGDILGIDAIFPYTISKNNILTVPSVRGRHIIRIQQKVNDFRTFFQNFSITTNANKLKTKRRTDWLIIDNEKHPYDMYPEGMAHSPSHHLSENLFEYLDKKKIDSWNWKSRRVIRLDTPEKITLTPNMLQTQR